MRFMVIVPANKDSEAGILPTPEQFAEMGKFNEEMAKAGTARGRRASTQLQGRADKVFGNQAHGHRRSVYGVERARSRILDDPSQVKGRSDRVDQARPAL